MSEEEKEKEHMEELAKALCHCTVHDIDFVCEDGCPECEE